jgi:hypothetical protein
MLKTLVRRFVQGTDLVTLLVSAVVGGTPGMVVIVLLSSNSPLAAGAMATIVLFTMACYYGSLRYAGPSSSAASRSSVGGWRDLQEVPWLFPRSCVYDSHNSCETPHCIRTNDSETATARSGHVPERLSIRESGSNLRSAGHYISTAQSECLFSSVGPRRPHSRVDAGPSMT